MVSKHLPLEECYEIITSIAGGTCGDVMKGKDKKTGEIVALKRIKIIDPKGGFPMNAMKEIQSLKELKHENIVQLRRVCVSNSQETNSVYLIFDYCEYDLQGLLSLKKLTLLEVKCYMRQLMNALNVCAEHNFIHRDLKPANLLLTPDNVVKLADFGLVKKIDPKAVTNKPMTPKVITIWYRPPELLMGSTKYGLEVDIWSAGCILYEMITNEVLFRSYMDQEADELSAIFRVCGFPNEEIWPGWTNLPNSSLVQNIKPNFPMSTLADHLNSRLPPEFAEANDLIQKMVQFDPSKRITAKEALLHPFIGENFEEFTPEKLEKMTFPEAHQYNISRKPAPKKTTRTRPKRVVPPKIK
ncbi:CMGC family protein kinase [Histomonas meleagridis]|uniref:CMGC family protein kinase n=1 Tax=Histomonas meleagridis TaxID=135588 RepID=UPI00355A9834|nr:CMGC family protein kinase [Histomonas meleagridis]KAH0801143.1 CMGC family protein kinase [Histomonas meleagridis]